jgi:2-dehydro-3-deoxygalactonokinase
MTGELHAVLLANSILGRLAEPREAGVASGQAFVQGVARGLGEGALGQLVFGARTLALTGELAGRDVADWLSGLLIGYEIRNATTWAARRRWDASRVRVIGSDALVARYVEALRLAGIAAEHGRADAAVHGIVRIAHLAGRAC